MGEKRVIEQVASNVVHNDDWFLKDSPTQDTSKISATNLKAILGADGTLALEEIANAIAEEYDSTHTYYNTGLVFHEGVLYQCTATSVTGTWDSTKWNVVDIKDLLDNVSTNIGYLWNTISNTIAGNYDTSSTYNTGDYAIYSLKLYRCKDDGVTGAWNSSKWEEVNIPEYIDYVLVNAGKVDDVKVDGTSVVTNKVAEIEIPVKDVQVKTDSTYDSVVDDNGNAKIDLSSVTAYGEVPNLPKPIATFKDGADAPMKSLKVAIEPQQDLHGYDSPWVGGAGKNKLPKTPQTGSNTIDGITWVVNDDGSIKVSGTATARSLFYYLPAGSYDTLNGEYTVSIEGMTEEMNNGFQIGGNWRSAKPAFTTTYENATIQQFWIDIAQGTTVNTTIKPMIRLATVADATFAPYSNICPISGWSAVNVTRTGKNLFDESILLECSGWTVSDGIYSGDSAQVNAKYGNGVPNLAFKPNTQYTFSFTYGQDGSAGIGLAIAIRYTDDTVTQKYCTLDTIGFVSVTSTAGKSIKRLELSYGANRTIHLSNMQLEESTTATTYSPYNGATYTIDLDGTRYGGEVDVVNGVLTVDAPDTLRVKLSSMNWAYQDGQGRFYGIAPANIRKPTTNSELPQYFMCECYRANPYASYQNGDITITTTGSVFVKDGNYTDVTTWLNAVGDYYVTFSLATPITIQLTPTAVKSLLGSNNVWADTGDINECIYRRDMSSTIDDIIARIEALENA